MIKKSAGQRSRSAITGRYVKKEYAKRHPKTTVTEKAKPQRKRMWMGLFSSLSLRLDR